MKQTPWLQPTSWYELRQCRHVALSFLLVAMWHVTIFGHSRPSQHHLGPACPNRSACSVSTSGTKDSLSRVTENAIRTWLTISYIMFGTVEQYVSLAVMHSNISFAINQCVARTPNYISCLSQISGCLSLVHSIGAPRIRRTKSPESTILGRTRHMATDKVRTWLMFLHTLLSSNHNSQRWSMLWRKQWLVTQRAWLVMLFIWGLCHQL